ncbi:glycosyltransferase [Aneurinibacillus danicus]|uniref:Glycosyltransferase 2-like domain-containing protein n=1 Tax=Aneurinibacillus danicus TaxID=267746 RepID=A0A511VB61_9BACL|nr:glycosyltransferase [Aneurinibacillus danicus]GEN35148.1 hypothetical protein ADA01nite_26080 [Aneurinibacillus danicus]
MKILLTVNDLQSYSGTGTYTYTLAKSLLLKGHEVFCFSTKLGKLAKKLLEIGAFVTDKIDEIPYDLDIIHAQHRMEAIIAYTRFYNKPMVYVCHGVLPWQEQPLFLPNIYRYVAISEEIKESLISRYDIDPSKIEIIRNGIELERFTSVKLINKAPEKILLLSNRFTDEVINTISSACKKLDLDLEVIGQSEKVEWQVEKKINDADIVVSLGRGILEAMACQRVAFVYDYNGGDGIVTPFNYTELRKKNFSGRTNSIKYDEYSFIEELQNYSSEITKENLAIIQKYHDINVISEELLCLYKEAINEQGDKSIIGFYDFSIQLNNIYKNLNREMDQKELNVNYLKEIIKEKENLLCKVYEETEDLKLRLKDIHQEKEAEASKYQKQVNFYLKETEKKERNLKYLLELNEQKEENLKYLLELNESKENELKLIYTSKAWKAVSKYRRIKHLFTKAINNPSLVFRKLFKISKPENKILRDVDILKASSEPLISVVIPIYDRTDVLVESIESILNQSFQDFELLLVCDGSPEETLKIVDSYRNHPKVRIFKFLNNSGNAVRGRNKAIKEARGKYLAFQDSDDIADLDRLALSLNYIEKYKVDVVYGGWRALIDGTRDIDIKDKQEIFSPDCDYEMLKEICVPCQSTVMAKVEALREVGGLKTTMKYREDHELWLRMAYKKYKFKAIPKILTNLRLHGNNLELKYKEEDRHWYNLMLEEHVIIPKLKPKIAYVIPGCGISGGIAVICQHVNRLLKRGYDVTLITEDEKKSIDWFPNQQVQIISLEEVPDNLDIVVATGWSTAYTIERIPAKRKIYFVQSDESRFHPKESKEYQLAWNSYKFNYEYMTEAKWIQRWLKENFNQNAYYVPNGLDEEIIHKAEPLIPKGDKLRVLLEGPIDIPFKGMKDAFEAVQGLDCEVWCVSSAGKPKPEWKCDQFFEKVPMNKMKNIYSSCDILLKMSRVEGFFGPPLEMMACGGVCVVGEVTGYDEYIKHNYNALVVKQGDIEGAHKAVKELIENKELRDALIINGENTASQWRWEPTIDILEEIFTKVDVKEVN